jgi:uncharacterized damage-inducible protein DinB
MATFTKEELRDHYRAVRQVLMAAIEGLSEAEMLEPSLDGWSVKDHLAHLSAWDEVRVMEIDRISAGRRSVWPIMTREQVDAFNDLTVEVRRPLSVEEVIREMTASREGVIAAIERASERALDSSRYGEAGLRSIHDLDHAETIRQWREQR